MIKYADGRKDVIHTQVPTNQNQSNQPSSNQPASNQPSYNQPIYNQPASNPPSYNQPQINNYQNNTNASDPTIPLNNVELYEQGVVDAIKFYEPTRCGSGGTIATCIVLSPLFGLIPAIACSATPPSDTRFIMPNRKLAENDIYRNGYRKQAHKMKQRQIWKSFAFATIAYALIMIVAHNP